MILKCTSALCTHHNGGNPVEVIPKLQQDGFTKSLKATCPKCLGFLGFVDPGHLDKTPSVMAPGMYTPAAQRAKSQLTPEQESKARKVHRRIKAMRQLEDGSWNRR